MPDTATDTEVDTHFQDLGDLVIENEGVTIKMHVFECISCSSIVAVKRKHWDTHNSIALGVAWT
jgi:hypothetical protein